MSRLHFAVLSDGTLNPAPLVMEVESSASVAASVGASLPLFAEDDEDDSPEDVSASFGELWSLLASETRQPQKRPLAAEFEIGKDGGLTLICWPRNGLRAVIPAVLDGRSVTAIGPLAFAPMQLTQPERWENLNTSPVSFSVFCMRNGKYFTPLQDGPGPQEILLPDSVTEIGPFAFWDCGQLEALNLPDGISELGPGVFAGCTSLKHLELPKALRSIGAFPPETVQLMPDIGTFNGCHTLKELALPEYVEAIGAHVFNSCGVETLMVEDNGETVWQRDFQLHPTAFDHSASLQWMGKRIPGGETAWQIGLPVGKDKILRSDPKFGLISQVPYLFFRYSPREIDELAFSTGRVDFLGRMAIARLGCPTLLDSEIEGRYLDFMAANFWAIDQFWPPGDRPFYAAFRLMEGCSGFTSSQLNLLLRQAGQLHLPADLISHIIEVRNSRFQTVTGFEDLEL